MPTLSPSKCRRPRRCLAVQLQTSQDVARLLKVRHAADDPLPLQGARQLSLPHVRDPQAHRRHAPHQRTARPVAADAGSTACRCCRQPTAPIPARMASSPAAVSSATPRPYRPAPGAQYRSRRTSFRPINFGRVRGLFLKPPFAIGAPAATVLAQICTHRNGLPQGAPTSPVLSNFIAATLDRRLTAARA